MTSAQRVITGLESNIDGEMLQQADSTEYDSKGKKKKKTVPVDVHAWTIDETYGNRTFVDVDTLHHQYQNNDLTEGMNGHFNHLGNLGSPRINRIYMERDFPHEFIFLNPIDQFVVTPSELLFHNTKSPLTTLSYNFCGSRDTGHDHFNALHTRNIGRKANYGLKYDYDYGQGYYANLSTSYMNGSGWLSFIDDRYQLHLYYSHDHIKRYENGGILSDDYITNPEKITSGFSSKDILTNLSENWAKDEHDMLFLTHKYNVGFTKVEGDSANLHERFIPVTSFFHTMKLEKYKRRYLSYSDPSTYFTHNYLHEDSISDLTRDFTVRNLVGLSLCEGFNKYAAAGINLYAGLEHQRFEQPDTVETGSQYAHKYKYNNFFIGGQIVRSQGQHIHYDVSTEVALAGRKAGNFLIEGNGEFNFRLLKDTAQVQLKASVRSDDLGFYMSHFHSALAWWDKEPDNQFSTRVLGTIYLAKTKTWLTLGLENVKNRLYFQREATPRTKDTNGNPESYTYAVGVKQHQGNIQVFHANLRQNFQTGIFHLDNDITYQASSNQSILPVPTLSLYHNLYITFKIAKVLNCEFGADMKFFTEYEAPDYAPSIGQFAIQSDNTKMKIGNYPIISVYWNLQLKRTRFYIMYYHANQGEGKYFWAPHYPVEPRGLRFGLSWNFYN